MGHNMSTFGTSPHLSLCQDYSFFSFFLRLQDFLLFQESLLLRQPQCVIEPAYRFHFTIKLVWPDSQRSPEFQHFHFSSVPYYFSIHLDEEDYIKITGDVKMCNQQRSITEKEAHLQQERFWLHINNNFLIVKMLFLHQLLNILPEIVHEITILKDVFCFFAF